MSSTSSHIPVHSKFSWSVHWIAFLTKFVDNLLFETNFNKCRVYLCEGADCSHATPSLSSFADTARGGRMLEKTGKRGNTRRACGVNFLQSSILSPEMSDTKLVAVKGNTLIKGENEEIMVAEEMNEDELGRTGGHEAPLLAEIGDILLFAVLLMGE